VQRYGKPLTPKGDHEFNFIAVFDLPNGYCEQDKIQEKQLQFKSIVYWTFSCFIGHFFISGLSATTKFYPPYPPFW